MTKNVQKIFILGLIAPLFFSCSTEDLGEDLSSLDSRGAAGETEDIAPGDLHGTWVMHSMSSDVAVDLNFDEESSNDVLAETDCFDQSFFTFNKEGAMTTGQAKLDFGTDNNEFECGYGEYEASYSLEGNELVIQVEINDSMVSQSKTIALSNDASGDYLHVSLEDFEVAEFLNDPGTTVASDVERIEIVYKKQ